MTQILQKKNIYIGPPDDFNQPPETISRRFV